MGVCREKVQIAITELIREKNVRERYYPNAIAERKLTQREANRRLEALTAAIEILSELLKHGVVAIEDKEQVEGILQEVKLI